MRQLSKALPLEAPQSREANIFMPFYGHTRAHGKEEEAKNPLNHTANTPFKTSTVKRPTEHECMFAAKALCPLQGEQCLKCEVIPLYSLQLQACVLSLLPTEGYLISFLIKSTKFFPNHLLYYTLCTWAIRQYPHILEESTASFKSEETAPELIMSIKTFSLHPADKPISLEQQWDYKNKKAWL